MKRRDQEDEDLDLEEEDEAPRRGKGRRDEDDEDDDIDFDEATGSRDPKCPPCTVDLEFQGATLDWGRNPNISGKALMFEATFKVVKVIDMPDELDDEEYGEDEDRPPHPVRKGEIRRVSLKVGPKKFKKPPPDAARARDLAQALLRFVPKSRKAENAVDVKGKKVSWNNVIREDVCGEDGDLAGQVVRATFVRFKAKKSKYYMIRPTFTLSPLVEERENNVVDSL